MISFIVPAHNEEKRLGQTLPAIHESAGATGLAYEILVVNDASTDATAELARNHGARVVDVNHRQIAATRNSGARAARGDRLFFIDADTIATPRAVAAGLKAMDKGAIGGGASVWFDGPLPLYGWLTNWIQGVLVKISGFCGGAFMFCTKEAYEKSGGFNEKLYFSEEAGWLTALKKQGRFVVIWPRVVTSGRRMRTLFRDLNFLHAISFALRLVFRPSKVLTQRKAVQKIWYDSNRAHDDELPNSWQARASNGMALLLMLVLLSGPIWNFIPWSWTPIATAAGKLRLGIALFLCHVGLVFWPCAIVLTALLVRQKTAREWLRFSALIAVCVWQGWGAVEGVIWGWTQFGRWLAAICL